MAPMPVESLLPSQSRPFSFQAAIVLGVRPFQPFPMLRPILPALGGIALLTQPLIQPTLAQDQPGLIVGGLRLIDNGSFLVELKR